MEAARERSAAGAAEGCEAEATATTAVATAEEMVVARAGARSAGMGRWVGRAVVWAMDLELEEGACWHGACRRPAIGSRASVVRVVALTDSVLEAATVVGEAVEASRVGRAVGRAP